MSDIQKQKRWFNSLKKELDRFFSDEESREIMNYYEEMFNEKLDNGEDIDHVLDHYDPKKIAKQMIPEVVSRRSVEKVKSNAWLVLLILFSTPILIPLGIVYLTLMIVAVVLIFTGFIVAASSIFGIFGFIIQLVMSGVTGANLLLAIGIGLIGLAILMGVGYLLTKVSWVVLKQLSIWFSKLITRKKD